MNKAIGIILAGLLVLGGCGTATNSNTGETGATPSPTKTVTPKVAPTKELTVAQKNAKRSAESYLETAGFSKKGLLTQLKFEGYSVKDATVAINTLKVNWNKEAEESAKSYVDTMGFSRSGLIQQLKFDGYTATQAAHGADSVGL